MAVSTTTPSPEAEFVAPPAARRFRFLGDRRLAALFITPALALLLFLTIFPLLWALSLSFTNYSATSAAPYNWVGLHNYGSILGDPAVHERAVTTLVFVGGAVALETLLGFSIAYLISRRVRGQGVLTTLFLLPMMLAPIVVGLFWRFMLDSQFGVVNSILNSLGLGSVLWLSKPQLAMLSLVVVDAWQWTPFIMLISLAGLTAVPKYLYEAAEIDRASEWFRFTRITLPLVWPLLLIGILFRAIDAFRMFDLVFILTGGGPGDTTETLSYSVYKVAFLGFDTGRASAYGLLMVVVVMILAQLLIRYLNRLQTH
jgi:multiple sugar transport system permease protein